MQLDFRKYTPADAPIVRRLVSGQPYRSCDFTVGGLLLWADYYGYEFAVADDTLFVRGRAEDGRPAYLLPVGALPPVQSVAALCGYCRGRGAHSLPAGAAGGLVGLPLSAPKAGRAARQRAAPQAQPRQQIRARFPRPRL